MKQWARRDAVKCVGVAAVVLPLALLGCSTPDQTDSTACVESFSLTGERNAHSLIFEELSGNVLLFGGADSSRVCGDTWEWDGSSWENTDQSGPSPRTFAAMAHDVNLASSYLFGGNRVLFGKRSFWPFTHEPTVLGDFWIRSDDAWKLVTSAGISPGARAEAAMAFDTDRDRLILFGGYSQEEGEINRLGDTWEWDGNSWALMSSNGPSPQNGASMAYDPVRKITVLYAQSEDRSKAMTWEWNGSIWKFIDVGESPRRFNSSLTYDGKLERVIRFGGWSGEQRVADTSAYDGVTWTEIKGPGPDARNHSAMVYDSKEGRIILYGGHNGDSVFADMWELRDSVWAPLNVREPLQRVNNGH